MPSQYFPHKSAEIRVFASYMRAVPAQVSYLKVEFSRWLEVPGVGIIQLVFDIANIEVYVITLCTEDNSVGRVGI
ncbi:unnamed protein product [Allacma fusca]|uniref:Uncharacterized protein n=1 Tax=Allacma fusca TaxID=39272 RepID=A0A8J2PJZ4_9HEXA|nr:unnamed protein product [Allacma fusca]